MYTSRFAVNKAKYAFPCFDNPRFEAGFKFKVYVLPQRADMQYTNTSLVISEVTKDYLIINYMLSPQVTLNQVGFHFSQFAHNQLKATHTNDTIYVWAPSEELYSYNFILRYGVKIIDLIHEFSGTRRPLLNGPINIVAVPTKLDGYEISSWNLLTNSYYGLRMKHQAMSYDWHHSTPALINFNVSLAIEITSQYKELVTMKTGAIWRGQYISVWDLIRAIDKDTIECTYQFFNGSTPSRILESWFHQAGYPVVTVNVLRDRTPNAIQLKQRRFSYNPRNYEPTDYLIPISYLLQSSENCINCHQPRFTIAQTYTFSENLNGYYRVNYDTESWKLIAAALKTNPMLINEMNRAQTGYSLKISCRIWTMSAVS
ncbi:Aminopeptidase N-7, partial [Operophtera brumata]